MKKGIRFIRSLVFLAGLIFLAQVALAAIGLPRSFNRWINGRDLLAAREPDVAVVLGGGGIPSDSGLMRTYFGADFGRRRPWLRYIVSLPAEENPYASSVGKMRDEMVLRGVNPEAIELEYRGRNTHEQARSIRGMFREDELDDPILIISSGYHMRRSILCFRREGFTNVVGLPTNSADVEADLGGGTRFRYGVWQSMQYQIRLFRELVALGYYKFRGWI